MHHLHDGCFALSGFLVLARFSRNGSHSSLTCLDNKESFGYFIIGEQAGRKAFKDNDNVIIGWRMRLLSQSESFAECASEESF